MIAAPDFVAQPAAVLRSSPRAIAIERVRTLDPACFALVMTMSLVGYRNRRAGWPKCDPFRNVWSGPVDPGEILRISRGTPVGRCERTESKMGRSLLE